MTIEDIQDELKNIHKEIHDPEAAHADLDELYISVLVAIAKGAKNPWRLAREALKGENISFPRWCA